MSVPQPNDGLKGLAPVEPKKPAGIMPNAQHQTFHGFMTGDEAVNCSAVLTRARRNMATARSALAAGTDLACALAMVSVVCRAWRERVAMACSSKGRLVIASRCQSGSARRTKMFHQL